MADRMAKNRAWPATLGLIAACCARTNHPNGQVAHPNWPPPEDLRCAAPPAGTSVFFAFASSIKGYPDGPSAEVVRRLVERHGKDIVIGFDAGVLSEGQACGSLKNRPLASVSGLLTARELGVKLHVYVEGPGGPTCRSDEPCEKWSRDETMRIQAASKCVCESNVDKQTSCVPVSVKDQERPTNRELEPWDKEQWWTYTRQQLAGFRSHGFETAEIDNLARLPSIGESPQGLVRFLRMYQEAWAAADASALAPGAPNRGALPRLVLKNLSTAQWAAVSAAVQSSEAESRLDREMLAAFAIEEIGWDEQLGPNAASTLGIRVLFSADSEEYAAWGCYDDR